MHFKQEIQENRAGHTQKWPLLVFCTWTFLIFTNFICSGYLSFLKLKSKITLLKWWCHLLSRGTLSQEKNLQTAKDAFWSRYHGKGFKYTNSSDVWNLNYSIQLIVCGIRRQKFCFILKKKKKIIMSQHLLLSEYFQIKYNEKKNLN